MLGDEQVFAFQVSMSKIKRVKISDGTRDLEKPQVCLRFVNASKVLDIVEEISIFRTAVKRKIYDKIKFTGSHKDYWILNKLHWIL
jgi:hypothetical protein